MDEIARPSPAVTGNILETCPECGRHRGDWTALGRLFRWQRWVPIVVMVIALAGVIGLMVSDASRFGFGSGVASLQFLEKPYTRSEVEAISRGESRGGSEAGTNLVDEVLKSVRETRDDDLPGKTFLEVNFVTSKGRTSQTESVGWPTKLWMITRFPRYENVAARTGFQPCRTDSSQSVETRPFLMHLDPLLIPLRQRWVWNQPMALVYQPPPEETGGVQTNVMFQLWNWLTIPALLLVIWLISRLLASIIDGLAKSRRLARRTRWTTFLLLAAALLAKCLTTVDRQERVSLDLHPIPDSTGGLNSWTYPGCAPLTLTLEDLESLQAQPDAERTLAQAIVNAGPRAWARSPAYDAAQKRQIAEEQLAGPDGLYLTIRGVPEADNSIASKGVTYGRLLRVLMILESSFIDRSGAAMADTSPSRWSWHAPWVRFDQPNPSTPGGRRTIQFNFANAATVILAIGVLVWFTRSLAALVGRMKARSRHLKIRCIACNYPLAPLL